jgi:uncharacterized protein (DUF4415 family)
MKRLSLAEIRRMKDRGELHHDPMALEGPAPEDDLGPDFWANAVVETRRSKSIHLKMDPDDFDFFYRETGGKGHLTLMRQVLHAYVKSKRKSA